MNDTLVKIENALDKFASKLPQVPMIGGNPLILAILTTLFCCLPFGVVSIIYAVNAGSATDEAAKKLNTEKSVKWANYAVWIGIILIVISIVLNILLGVLGAAAA